MDHLALTAALAPIKLADLRVFDTVGSTNDEALAWLDAGASDCSLVISDEQTKGRGRFDRRWVTRPGSALAFSLILKPNQFETTKLALFAPLCGLAVHDALKDLYSLDTEIKWPNDILIQRQKCCGILVEAAWTSNQPRGIVLGIGINITPESVPPIDLLRFPATCLETSLARPVDRIQVLAAIISHILTWRPQLATKEFFAWWQDHLAFRGEQVVITQAQKPSIIGIEKGIDTAGNLVLTLENNIEMAFEVGDVHLSPMA